MLDAERMDIIGIWLMRVFSLHLSLICLILFFIVPFPFISFVSYVVLALTCLLVLGIVRKTDWAPGISIFSSIFVGLMSYILVGVLSSGFLEIHPIQYTYYNLLVILSFITTAIGFLGGSLVQVSQLKTRYDDSDYHRLHQKIESY
ncbi:MAG: hypothetical protein ACFFCS_23570 [Candidatus Hodarchaeota archaeon]